MAHKTTRGKVRSFDRAYWAEQGRAGIDFSGQVRFDAPSLEDPQHYLERFLSEAEIGKHHGQVTAMPWRQQPTAAAPGI